MNSSLRSNSPLSESLLSRRGWRRCCWLCTSEKKKTLFIVGRNANTFRHYGNQYKESLKTQILDNSAILLLLMYTKDSKLVNLDSCIPMLIKAIFRTVMATIYVPINQLSDKDSVVYIHQRLSVLYKLKLYCL